MDADYDSLPTGRMLKNPSSAVWIVVAAVSEAVKEFVKPNHPPLRGTLSRRLPEGEGSWHVEQTKALSLWERVPRQRRVRAGIQFIHTFSDRRYFVDSRKSRRSESAATVESPPDHRLPPQVSLEIGPLRGVFGSTANEEVVWTFGKCCLWCY